MAVLTVRLFGTFELSVDSGGTVVVPIRKAQALVAYLALPAGRSHLRDALAALLWGDMHQTQARSNLRQTLYELRKGLGDAAGALVLDGEHARLEAAAVVVDAVAFQRAAAEGTAEALERAGALYRGDLLAGLVIDEAPFEEWLLAERERLRQIALSSAARLLALQRSTAPEAAIQTALRLLAIDPLQEPVHRTLMRLYLATGRRREALRQYERCAAVLERQLHTEPDPETRALHREILQRRLTTELAPPAEPERPVAPPVAEHPRQVASPLPPADTPMVGRARELAALREALDTAWQGRSRMAIVTGEAGIGKTRLVTEVMREAASRGGVLLGRAYESEQVFPFGVWVDAIRAADVLDDPAVLAALAPAWRMELARLFPELTPPETTFRPDAGDAIRLFESLTHLLRLLAARPLLIVLEDAHWADEMSLRFLAYAARRLIERVMLVITAREEELGERPVLRAAMQEVDRERPALRLSLGPLTAPETASLVEALAPSHGGASAGLARQAWTVSEGNPLLAIETTLALAAGDALSGAGDVALPRRVQEVVALNLSRVSPPARALVSAAAVIGRRFDFRLLQHAAATSEHEAAQGVEELVRRRVLCIADDGLDFTHARIRDVAYAQLLPPTRKLLHGQVAAGLEALYGPHGGAHLESLAVHYRDAQVWDKAVDALARLAVEAARGYAHTTAIALLDEALGHLARLPAGLSRDRRRIELQLHRARSLYGVGRFQESAETLVAEMAGIDRIGDPALASACHAWVANIEARLGHPARAVASARRALDAAAQAGDDAVAGQAHLVLAETAFWQARAHEGFHDAERAVALLARAGDRWRLGMAYFHLAVNAVLLGRFEAARTALASARATGEAVEDNRILCFAAWFGGWLAALEGDHAGALAACRRALDLATDQTSETLAEGALGFVHVERGDAPAAAPLLERTVARLDRFGFRSFRPMYTVLLAETRRLEGNLVVARSLAMDGIDASLAVGYPEGVNWARRVLARIARDAGEVDEAGRHLREALEGFAATHQPFEVARVSLELAELQHACGAGDAAEHLTTAVRLFREIGVARWLARADRLAASLGITLPAA
jgi:DNA-binding SARP family transcriptional activator